MNLYELHDNPGGSLHLDETTWAAIWANSPEEAKAMYLKYLLNVTDQCEEDIAGLDPRCKEVEQPAAPEKDTPHVEERPEVHRLLGWRVESERGCGTCGLYPNDLPQYRVCEECDNCPECGCCCERQG